MSDRRDPPPHDESLSPGEKLGRRSDFQRCYRSGRRRHGAYAVLYEAPNEVGHPRLGITVSRKVGKAVVRTRLKRRIREIYRRWRERSKLPASDLVVHAKPEAASAGFDQLEAELVGLLRRSLPRRSATR